VRVWCRWNDTRRTRWTITAAAPRKLPVASRTKTAQDLWHEAVQIRQEWLDHGLSTQPADRVSAERSLCEIYARVARPQPRFEWVDSPSKALP
jgi:hypothetical protein